MGVKLSPPLLEGTIPAFYSTDQGIVITIPFSMNRVVSWKDVNEFEIKIKTIQSGTQIYSISVPKSNNQENCINFIINKTRKKENSEDGEENPDYKKFRVGQYYKFQIAYVNDETIGYYSTVAIGKYTTKPEVVIGGLDNTILNSHSYTYTGSYTQTADTTEKVYSYKFDLYDNENNLVSSSGDLLHNTNNDVENNQSQDTYTFFQDLPTGKTYRIQYTVTTNNGLVVSSPAYRITQKQSINPEIKATLHAILNPENGYISIDLKAIDETELSSGFFILSRTCEDSNYTTWDEIHRFNLVAEIANKHLCKDFTIEQGKNYIYAIQQYNRNNLFSNRILSNTVYADFEDAFLYDGKRQLKIKYDPKISSFKKDLLETKTDTIGGKHPFIFRNGRVYYSEFPISGLISYQMDEENLFLSEEDYGLTEKTTNLTGENIAAERTFKMKVLEWLTNGEPKLFRSPTEGNFIVRLMNSSLSPNDTIGRMLHTFSCTAYEVADFNYSTLGNMGFITIEDPNLSTLQWETVSFVGRAITDSQTGEKINFIQGLTIRTVRFDNMLPKEIVKITFEDGSVEEIKIGATCSYYVDTGVAIKSIELINPSTGSMTYSYDYVREPVFNSISSVEVEEIPHHQFIGEHDILQELLYVKDDEETWIKNPKLDLIEVYNLSVEKRPLQRIAKTDEASLDALDTTDLKDPFVLYELGTYKREWHNPSHYTDKFKLKYYYDAYNYKEYKDNNLIYEPLILFNGANISVNEKEFIEYTKPGKLTELKSGNGVLVNIGYQMGVIKYNIEDEAKEVKINENTSHYLYQLGKAIEDYEGSLSHLEEVLKEEQQSNNDEDSSTTEEENPSIINEDTEEEGSSITDEDQLISDIKSAREAVQETYRLYILELVKAQEEDLKRKGEIV